MASSNGDSPCAPRRVEMLAQSVWITLAARGASILGALLLAVLGYVAVEWHGEVKGLSETVENTALVLRETVVRQETMIRNDMRQDSQIDEIWRAFRSAR